jgi:hypothetical protein
MRRQKRISCYLPSVCRSGDRVNPLGEHRLQGSQRATKTTRKAGKTNQIAPNTHVFIFSPIAPRTSPGDRDLGST